LFKNYYFKNKKKINQIFLPDYPYSYKLLLLNFFAIEQQQQLQREQELLQKRIISVNELPIQKMNDEVH
jgi:hypothetical protein